MLSKTFGSCRFVYNHYLGKKIDLYKNQGKSMSYVECANDMKNLKTKLEWLKEIDAISLQQSLRDVDKAYKNFFKGSGISKKMLKYDAKYIDINNLLKLWLYSKNDDKKL